MCFPAFSCVSMILRLSDLHVDFLVFLETSRLPPKTSRSPPPTPRKSLGLHPHPRKPLAPSPPPQKKLSDPKPPKTSRSPPKLQCLSLPPPPPPVAGLFLSIHAGGIKSDCTIM